MAPSNPFSLLSLDPDSEEEEEAAERKSSSMPSNYKQQTSSKKKRKKGAIKKESSSVDALKLSSLSIDEDDPKRSPPITSPSAQNSIRQSLLSSSMAANSSLSGIPSERPASLAQLKWPLAWIDLEMTGLNVERDRILEIACIITDGKLEKAIEGPDLIIHQPEEVLKSMGEWCQTHHAANGLIDEVRKSKINEKEAEKQVKDFIKLHTGIGTKQPLLAGNSVYVDLLFLRKYMPDLAALFAHVLVDVSSIKALCLRWFPKDAENAPKKKNNHRALEDIKESIAELKFMQKNIFKDARR